MENGTEGACGALSTHEAMVVSMGFMAPPVAMFFNTPFIAGFAGGAMPLAMLFSFAAVFPLEGDEVVRSWLSRDL